MTSFGRFALVVPKTLRLNTHALPMISFYISINFASVFLEIVLPSRITL